MRDQVIIFGAGSGAREVLPHLRENNIQVIYIVSPDAVNPKWEGYPWISEEYFVKHPELLEGASLIIASQWHEDIYNRLKEKGVNLSDCHVINVHKWPPFHNKEVVSLDDDRYGQLATTLSDEASRTLLGHILKNRRDIKTKRYTWLMPYHKQPLNFATEDYWITRKAVRKNTRAVVIDCGAYTGDSIAPLCSAIGTGISHYYAFEPALQQYSDLQNFARFSPEYGELVIINKGVSSANTELNFYDNVERPKGSRFVDQPECSTCKVPVQTLDSLEIPDSEEPFDLFIKMDVEGSEMDALRGAEKLILSRKPALAICAYHLENDILDISFYLKSLVPEYKLYLVGGAHTIIIAQVED